MLRNKATHFLATVRPGPSGNHCSDLGKLTSLGQPTLSIVARQLDWTRFQACKRPWGKLTCFSVWLRLPQKLNPRDPQRTQRADSHNASLLLQAPTPQQSMGCRGTASGLWTQNPPPANLEGRAQAPASRNDMRHCCWLGQLPLRKPPGRTCQSQI